MQIVNVVFYLFTCACVFLVYILTFVASAVFVTQRALTEKWHRTVCTCVIIVQPQTQSYRQHTHVQHMPTHSHTHIQCRDSLINPCLIGLGVESSTYTIFLEQIIKAQCITAVCVRTHLCD